MMLVRSKRSCAASGAMISAVPKFFVMSIHSGPLLGVSSMPREDWNDRSFIPWPGLLNVALA
jgi:hypothetical protein